MKGRTAAAAGGNGSAAGLAGPAPAEDSLGALAALREQGTVFVPHFPPASGQLAGYDELTGPAEHLGAAVSHR